MLTIKFERTVFIFAGIIPSCFYFAFPSVYTKIIPILALCALSFTEGHKYGYLVSAGLLFSSVGDVLLRLNGGDFLYFMFGLINFLIAHLFYIAAYLSCKIDFKYWIATCVFFIAYYAALMSLLVPHIETMLIAAVLIYGLVICSMVFLGANRFFTTSISWNSRTCALLGSLFFAASDSVLAVNKFRGHVLYADYIVMVTYYIGQTLIAVSTKDPYPQDRELSMDYNAGLLDGDEQRRRSVK